MTKALLADRCHHPRLSLLCVLFLISVLPAALTVAQAPRPTASSLARWATDWVGRPEAIARAEGILAALTDEDLETWGYARKEIASELDAIDPTGKRKSRAALSRYTLERLVVTRLRRNIHHNALGRLVRRIRFACDVLLR